VINSYGFESLVYLNLHPICKHWCNAHKLNQFLFLFFFFPLPSCKTSMKTTNSSSYAFNSINDRHWEKVVTLTTYSWDVENTHDLIDPQYFQDCLNSFD
jgi:hypothetical protein